MRWRGNISSLLPKLLLMALFLALTPNAVAWTRYVDGVNGNDNNDCKTPQTACKTIGHAISLPAETIRVAPATYRENLTISKSLNIIGADAATTIVDGAGVGTVFTISNANSGVLLSKLTIRNGYGQDYGIGGGILNSGTLTVNNSTITANSAYASGGGILNYGRLTINESTISGNSVGGWGGGISNYGRLTINKSTLSNNSAWRGGGVDQDQSGLAITINNSTISSNGATIGAGVCNFSGTTTINNSTISGNTASAEYSAIDSSYGGLLTLQNSVVANGLTNNCFTWNAQIISNGYNLSSDNTCNFNGPEDMNNTDPKLGVLKNNGGPTQTQSLLNGSPAIDAGNPSGCTDGNGNLLKTDQRGRPRPGPTGVRCDIGALERQTQ